MQQSYEYPTYQYVRSPDQDAPTPPRHKVIVVGAGPVGLSAALDMAAQGVPVVLLDNDDTVSVGSRAICFSKRTLEILDRLGVGERAVDKGVTWKKGKVFSGDRAVYEFDLLPEEGHKNPAFINLQQYYLEEYLVDKAAESDLIDLRWKNNVTSISPKADGVALQVETPDGAYTLEADYVIACDGAKSRLRDMLGLDFIGQVFEDRFLIADVKMKADFPSERWFWFDPPFHRGQSALLHQQPDNVWRIDLQLGWDADPIQEKKPERVIPRLKKMLGDDAEFDLEWVSVYTFQCRRLESFRHGRVLFAGDAAHQVSPFGARGANSGIQDTDNLAWKLALVLDGKAPEALLDSYDEERTYAADENILNSTRSTDFITPKSKASRTLRQATLELAVEHDFARRLVNSGRLSVPAVLDGSRLNVADQGSFTARARPGSVAPDAPVAIDGKDAWLLDQIGGQFDILYFVDASAGIDAAVADALKGAVTDLDVPARAAVVALGGTLGEAAGLPVIVDVEGLMAERFDAKPGTVYLLRPDQHVAARWRTFDADALAAAVDHVLMRDKA